MDDILLFAQTFDKAYFLNWPDASDAPDLYYFYQEHNIPQAFNSAAHSSNRLVRVRFDEDWTEPRAAAFDAEIGVMIVLPKKVGSLLELDKLLTDSLNK